MVAPRTLIDPIPTTPPKHGLLTSAFPHPKAASDPEGRWELGFGFLPENCSEPESWVIPCVGPAGGNGPGATVTDNTEPEYPDGFLNFTPYQIQAEFECDTQSRNAVALEQRARRILEAGTSKAMAYELYEGRTVGVEALAADGNLQLTDSGTFTDSGPISTTATTPRLGLIQLVQAAARSNAGQRSMIHATPATVMAWWQSGSLAVEGERLVTAVGGHVVVAGAGYTGSGPDNVADADADVHWAWVTSPTYYLLGEVRVPMELIEEALNRPENDLQYIATRTAAAFWDGCLHTGVPINTMAALD